MSSVVYDTSLVITPLTAGEWIDAVPVISAVTLGELYSGIERGDVVERALRRQRVNYVAATYQVVPYGRDEAEGFGLLWSAMIELGRQPRSRALDLQIAATAVVHRLPLLTRNPRDLEGLERLLQVVAV